MADKKTLEAIEQLVSMRPRALLDSMMTLGIEPSRETVAAGLRFLAGDYREQANLVMESGARGKGAEATALRSTAGTLDQLADAVAKVETIDEPSPAPDAGLDEAMHPFKPGEGGKCVAQVDRGGDVYYCTRYASHPAHRSAEPQDLSALNALVAERSAPQVIPVQAGTTVLNPPVTVAAGETVFLGFATPDESAAMRAYLRGDTNVMPGDEPPAASPLASAEWPAHETQRGPVTDPEILKAAKVLEPVPVNVMFSDPVTRTYGVDPVIPGRRLTFVELRKPSPVEPPTHTSNSQVTQMNDCGLQYRLARLEPDVIERPQWHLVGGKALHRAAEEFERTCLATADPWSAITNAEVLWKESFNAEIMAQVMACPAVPMDDWRAAGRGGSEGYTWWLTQGADMVRRYLDMRRAESDRVLLVDSYTDRPILELEGVLDVEGTPHKVVIDQAWRWGPGADIVIDDLKSGANAPRGGTFQLAQYAWYLHKELGFGHAGSKIYGRYWDARKGTYSAPVDLLELHPWDEIVWRIKDAAAKKEAGLFGPNPGPFCGGCAVKHACPVVSRA
jgi:hypothetical protein